MTISSFDVYFPVEHSPASRLCSLVRQYGGEVF